MAKVYESSLGRAVERMDYRNRFGCDPCRSGNPRYAKIGRRTQQFAKLPSLEKLSGCRPKVKENKDNGRLVAKKDIWLYFQADNRIRGVELLESGYIICLSQRATIQKVKRGAVSRYLVRGF